MFSYIFPSSNSIEDIPISIVNEDRINGTHGNESLEFIEDLERMNDEEDYFILRESESESSSRDRITNCELYGSIIIGKNFTSDLRSGKQGDITVLYDQSKPQISTQINSILNSVINRMGTKKAVSTIK